VLVDRTEDDAVEGSLMPRAAARVSGGCRHGIHHFFRIQLGPRSNVVTYTALEQMLSADAYISWAHICRCQKASVHGTASPCRHDAPLSLPPRIGIVISAVVAAIA